MGFWSKLGKGIGKVGSVIAPFTGPFAPIVGGATGFVGGLAEGRGLKNALLQGGISAATSFIPGGGGVAGGFAKQGVKSLISGVAKGAATNFATGTATGLATGQGLKNSLRQGGSSAVTNLGAMGPSGGLKGAVTSGAKQVGLNAGLGLGSRFLGGGGQSGGGQNVYQGLLPQQGASGAAAGGGMDWKQALLQGGLGALSGSQGGGGWKGAAQGAAQSFGAPGGQPAGGGGYGGGYPGTPGYNGNAGLNVGGVQYPSFGGGGGGGGQRPSFIQQGNGPGGAPTGTGPTYPGGGAQPVFRSTTIAPQGATSVPGSAPQGQTTSTPKTPPGGPPTPSGGGFWEKYGPLIAQGGGLVVGGLAGRQATKMAQQRSPEELAALGGAQGAAGQLTRSGGQAVRQGANYVEKPASYFETLLSGNRAAMSQAVAGPTAQLTGVYRGAERNLDQQGVRGAARDVAATDLNRERASKIAGLTTGVQPYAAEQLAGLGQGLMQTGSGMLGTGGQLQGDLLRQGTANRIYARQEGGKTAEAIGGLARDVGEVAFKKPAPGAAPVNRPPNIKPIPTGGQVPLGGPGVGMSPAPPGPIPVGGGGVPLGEGYGMAPAPQGGTAQAPLPFQMNHVDFTGRKKPAVPFSGGWTGSW